MLEAIGIIALTIAAGATAVVAYAAAKPNNFRVARSVTIKAPPETIFPRISDLRQMNSWNPFVQQDPSVKGSYSGPASGNGAAYDFAGSRSGTGRIEITDTAPSSRVAMRLAMIKPFAGDNAVEFTLVPQNGATTVTWAMSCKSSLVPSIMGLFFNMDKMIGKSFDDGLAGLKTIVETG